MKTFRFFATLLVIVLCAGFTSCSDDDEEENSVEISLANLQGTWDMIKCYGWEYDDNNQRRIGQRMSLENISSLKIQTAMEDIVTVAILIILQVLLMVISLF